MAAPAEGAACWGEMLGAGAADRRFLAAAGRSFSWKKKKAQLSSSLESVCFSQEARRPIPKLQPPPLPARGARGGTRRGPGKVKAPRSCPWRAAGGGSGGARDDSPTPGFLHSASPPPLGAHRRPLPRPGSPRAALLRRRRSWRLDPGGGLCSARAAGAPARVSRGQPGLAGGRDGVLRALRSEQTSGGAGGARGRAGVRSPPSPADFRPQRGGWRGAARVPSRLETPPAAIGARPPCAPSERRASCCGALV